MAKKFNLTELLNQRSREALDGQQDAAAQEEAKKEEVMMIDVYDLLPSKDNFYRVDDELKRSIELVGVLQPLLVKKPEDGKYRVIAGHRRRLAVLALIDEGKEERRYLPCIYKPDDVRDRLAIIMANKFRDKTDWEKMREAVEAEELAKELKREMKLEGRTRELLSEITGVAEAQLGRYKSIYKNLIPELMAEFKKGSINVSVAAELSGMDEEWQMKAADKIADGDGLTIAEAKMLKWQQENESQIPGQLSFGESGQQDAAEGTGPAAAGQEEAEEDAEAEETEEYIEPQPETVDSICYTCDRYETCHEKKSTVTSCNAYIDRREAHKTEEQRYNEEQAKIDRETRRKMREQAQEAKMEQLPSEEKQKEHDIRITPKRYEEITSGKLTFLLLKKDGYKLGEEMRLPEFTDGRETGRGINVEVQYIWEDWTGLDEDYCILGLMVLAFD